MKRYRKHKISRRLINELKNLATTHQSKRLIKSRTISQDISLTENDRIIHVRRIDDSNKILEVVDVSYEIKINNEWITVVRYDSVHGYLHRHKRISIEDHAVLVDIEGVKKKGDPHVWYTWAIKDIQKRFLEYRADFTKRSRIPNLGY